MSSSDEQAGGAATATDPDLVGPNGAQPGAAIPVESPATGEVIATVPMLGADEVARLAERARAAQPGWEALGFDGRGEVLRRVQNWIGRNSERVIETIVAETGKTYEDAQLIDLVYSANACGFWAKRAPRYLAPERVRSTNPLVLGKKLRVTYHPVGVVGVIGPWNNPLTNSFGDCLPALAAGNAVILKPSEQTPLTSLLMEGALRECGAPEGVFQVATGTGETGAAVVDEADFVMFTGSAATGRKVMERAARTLTPVSLELGGNDPMIVLADAPIERAANCAVFWGLGNGGQTCISTERIYVEEPVYDEFVRVVSDKVSALRQGPPQGPGSVEVGAVTFPPQLEIVETHVRDAIERGARVATGGRPADLPHGRFYAPTVLVDADHGMKCMTEETFGPVLPIMKVPDADEAVRLANDSPYGLSASVFTSPARGERIAARLEAGAICVNDAQINYTALELPMGGWKQSGFGVRHGPDGIRKFTKQKSVLVTRIGPKREPQMFPYKAGATRLLGRGFKFMFARGKRGD